MSLRRLRRLGPVSAFIWGAGIIALGCKRDAPATRIDTTSPKPESASITQVSASQRSGWNGSAGPALLIQGENREEAIVLLPVEEDSADEARLNALGARGAGVTLYGRGGARLAGQLGAAPRSTDTECRVWPLRDVHGKGATSLWAVGFIGGQTAPLALDSVDVLSSRDSTTLVAEASRLASMVTSITDPSFQGLRFTVHDIRRFESSAGVQAIVAHLVRKVNQEANPQEEQTLLVAERDSGVTTGPYRLAYAERTHGLEEQTTTPEIVAAVSIAGRPTLIVARDNDAGVAYVLLERTGSRKWRIRWTSPLTRCE